MGRRTLLMIAAVVIAALGAGLIFVYVQGINDRAEASQEPRQVLAATQEIAAGESIDDAAAAGKLELVSFADKDVLDGPSTTETITGQIALTTIFPNEQIVPGKFGAPGSSQKITIPDKNMAISVQLDDPARVAEFSTWLEGRHLHDLSGSGGRHRRERGIHSTAPPERFCARRG